MLTLSINHGGVLLAAVSILIFWIYFTAYMDIYGSSSSKGDLSLSIKSVIYFMSVFFCYRPLGFK